MVDESGLDVVRGMVVDDDIQRRSYRNPVVRTGRRVVDEREQRLRWPVGHRLRVEFPEVDVQEVDERAVLLVGNLPVVEDVSLVDTRGDRDSTQRESAGEAVWVRVVVADNV